MPMASLSLIIMNRETICSSFWEHEVFYKDADIIIIGAGIVGLTAALNIKEKEPTSRVCILEKGHIPTGASTRNAGFACFGSISELKEDMLHIDREDVVETLKLRHEGLIEMRRWVTPDLCEYENLGGYELFTTDQEDLFQSCARLIPEYNQMMKEVLGISHTYSIKDGHVIGIKSKLPLIHNQYEGQLHPALLVNELIQKARANGVKVMFGMSVDAVEEEGNRVRVTCANDRSIMASQVIHATNAFSRKLLRVEDVIPVRNQVYVTQEISGLQLKGCFHHDRGYIYFRNVGNRVLIGGARNQVDTESVDEFGTTDEVRQILKEFLESQILDAEVKFEYGWSGIIATGSTKKPIIKRINKHHIAAYRLGGMGVAIGSMVGKKAAALALS